MKLIRDYILVIYIYVNYNPNAVKILFFECHHSKKYGYQVLNNIAKLYMPKCMSLISRVYVTGHGKRAHFAHYFKIELLVFKDSVDLKQ